MKAYSSWERLYEMGYKKLEYMIQIWYKLYFYVNLVL